MKKIEERLRTYESTERERLGLEPGPMPQWTETAHNRFFLKNRVTFDSRALWIAITISVYAKTKKPK